MNSILTKCQKRTFEKTITEDGRTKTVVVNVRYDDECGNGHNTFAITCEVYRGTQKTESRWESGGCNHDYVTDHFPDLAPLVKWHLCSSDGPLHYVANTVYHASEYSPRYAWVYYTPPLDPLGLMDDIETLLGYFSADKASKVEGQERYRVRWDEKSAKERNLDFARSSAIWPEATDEELTAPDLEQRLLERLPKLMAEFRAVVESLGFTY